MKIPAVIISLSCSLSTCWAIQVANYSSATNDLFGNDPSFIGDGFDFSGVGRAALQGGNNSQRGRWATLIGDNYFLTVSHFGANTGYDVSFANGGSSFSYTVAGTFNVPGTDIRIGYFNEAADSSLARYSYNTNSANQLSDLGLGSSDLFTLGDQVTGAAGGLLDIVVGTNQAESWFEEGTTTVVAPGSVDNIFSSAAGFDQVVTFENVLSDDAFTAFEAQLEAGDSGSPLFSVVGGELRVEGLGYAVVADPSFLEGNFEDTPGPMDGLELREATFYSQLGSYKDGIELAIAGVPSPIPEPSALLLVASAVGVSLSRRQRVVC